MRQPTAESARVREEALRVAGAMGAVPGVESVILFGSAARGTATEWSDCDLAVLARSREACERAGAVADERLDGALHVVGMHPGNGYAGAAVWGTVGCEALWTGEALWGEDARQELKMRMERVTRPMTVEEAARRQAKVLVEVGAALDAWIEHLRAPRDEARAHAAAKRSADAAEAVVKMAFAVRGFPQAWSHALPEIFEEARKDGWRSEHALLTEGTQDEDVARLGELCGRLNGGTKTDHTAMYFDAEDRIPAPSSAERIGERMAELIRSAREERSKLAAARGMEGIGERLAEAEALVAEKLERVTGEAWGDREGRRRVVVERVREEARAWRADLELGERSGGRGDAGLLGDPVGGTAAGAAARRWGGREAGQESKKDGRGGRSADGGPRGGPRTQ